jgi:hypothetical protein
MNLSVSEQAPKAETRRGQNIKCVEFQSNNWRRMRHKKEQREGKKVIFCNIIEMKI